MNTLSITGLSEGTTKVYLDKLYIGLTLHIEVATVTVTQHQWGSEYRIGIEPTCLLVGEKAIYCEKRSKKQDSSEMTIPAKGHTEVIDEAVAPTCTENGKTEGSKREHTWDSGKITTEATTTNQGEKTYTCTVCKTTRTEIIPKITGNSNGNNNDSISVNSNNVDEISKEKKPQTIKVTTSKKISAKGTKKGTYKIKVKMTVAGNNMYKSYSTTKTITIKIK